MKNKSAKELWKDAEFPFYTKVNDGIVIVSDEKDKDIIGALIVEIHDNGYFHGYCKSYSDEGYTSLSFDDRMTKALLQQFKEFGFLK